MKKPKINFQEINRLIWLYFSIWACDLLELIFLFYILMISSWLKTKALFVFYHQLLLKLSRARRKRNKKYNFRPSFLNLQIFEASENWGIDFTITLNKCFSTNINNFEVTIFNWKFYTLLNRFRACCCNTNTPAIYL